MPAIGGSGAGGLHMEMGTGALFSSGLIPAGLRDVSGNRPLGPNVIFVRLRAGADRAAALRTLDQIAAKQLTLPTNWGVTVIGVQHPAEIVNYRSMSSTPLYLGAALAAGAVAALALTLVTSVRRRRRDLALLKTLGFTRRQLAAAVAWQSTVAVAIGIVIGIPTGIIAGRSLWDLFAAPDPRGSASDRSGCHDPDRRSRRARARQPGCGDTRPAGGAHADRGVAARGVAGSPTVGAWTRLSRHFSGSARATSTSRCRGVGATQSRPSRAGSLIDTASRALGLSAPAYALDRRGTAASLRAIDEANGGGFYDVPDRALHEIEAAEAAFGGRAPVIDVQTHLVDPARWIGPGAAALAGFLRMADPDRWPGEIDPHVIDGAAWAALVFGASETAIALLTSTPGPAATNVLTNPQIAAARDVIDRYAGSGRVLTHTIVHPNLGPHELDAMDEWSARLSPSGWKCYTLYGPPTKASPTGGWFLDDDEIGTPFLERVDALGPRVVATHKGLGGPVPERSVEAASPRDIGPAAAAFPGIDFVVYHSGYERDPDGREGPVRPARRDTRRRPADPQPRARRHRAGRQRPGGNVYAELGSTWFLMLRRPVEAAHVLGKLLRALGPERIVWGTDSTWYGSPQPLIDAFRAFAIPPRMQEEFGYPAITAADKDRILSANAQRLYGVDRRRAAHGRPRARPVVGRERVSRAERARSDAPADPPTRVSVRRARASGLARVQARRPRAGGTRARRRSRSTAADRRVVGLRQREVGRGRLGRPRSRRAPRHPSGP